MIPYLSVRSPLVSLGLGAISCLVMVGRGIQFFFSDRSDSLIFACGAYGPPGCGLLGMPLNTRERYFLA